MEGFSVGCGDAVLSLNPVDDSVESVARILKQFDDFRNEWEIPTQICVLAHVTTQIEAAKKLNALRKDCHQRNLRKAIRYRRTGYS